MKFGRIKIWLQFHIDNPWLMVISKKCSWRFFFITCRNSVNKFITSYGLEFYGIHAFDECLHPRTLPILLLSFDSEKICRINFTSMSGREKVLSFWKYFYDSCGSNLLLCASQEAISLFSLLILRTSAFFQGINIPSF